MEETLDFEIIPEEDALHEAEQHRCRIAMGLEELEDDWEPRRGDWDDLNNFL